MLVLLLVTLIFASGCNQSLSSGELKQELQKQLEAPWTVTSLEITATENLSESPRQLDPELQTAADALEKALEANKGDSAAQDKSASRDNTARHKYSFTASIVPTEALYQKMFSISGTQVLRKLRNKGEAKSITGVATGTHGGEWKLVFNFETNPYLKEGKPASAWPAPHVELDSTGFEQLLATAKQDLQPLEARIKEQESRVKLAKEKYLEKKQQLAEIETALFQKADAAFNSIKEDLVKFNIRIDNQVQAYAEKTRKEFEKRVRDIQKKYDVQASVPGQDEAEVESLQQERARIVRNLNLERQEMLVKYKHGLLETHQQEKAKILAPYTALNEKFEAQKRRSNDIIKQMNAEISVLKKELKALVNNRQEIRLVLGYADANA